MATSKKKDMESFVDQFCAITGSSRDVGESMFEACNGNLELAVDMHMEGGENSRRAGASAAAGTSMASTSHNDEVRAPIPQRTETLVEDAPSYGFRGRRRAARSVFDGFRDFQAETRQQEAMRSVTRNSAKRKTLEDLFRPPIDLIHKGTFSSARDLGTSKSCWLMVNVQNVQEFACQALNRDVWSNSAVKSIIKQHFVFWQVYHDSEEGRKYMQFYKISDWPYVAILDPRTGENMAVWSKLDNMTFCDLVTEFLAQNPSLDGSLTSSPPAKRKKRENSIVDASEDAQMMAAIQASLKEESSKSPTSKPETVTLSDSDISDSDDLETFSDSDEKSSNASPVKKPKLDSEKTSCRKQNLTSKLANSEQSKPSPKKACNNSPGKKCSKRRRSSSDKEEEKCNKKEHSSIKSDSETAKEESVVETLPERWRNYLGKADDCPATLMFRYPDGSREQLCIPHTSQLWALVYFVIEKGYSNEQYELVTQFPRRRISDLDLDSTLQQSGLHQRETVFVQSR